jgi:hypothetical protein
MSTAPEVPRQDDAYMSASHGAPPKQINSIFADCNPDDDSAFARVVVAQTMRHPLFAKRNRDNISSLAIRLSAAWKALMLQISLPVVDDIAPMLVDCFLRELESINPGQWRRGNQGTEGKVEKTIEHDISSGELSFQLIVDSSSSYRIRHPTATQTGYHVLVNNEDRYLKLVRFAWIDETDWVPAEDAAETMMELPARVIKRQAMVVPGAYLRRFMREAYQPYYQQRMQEVATRGFEDPQFQDFAGRMFETLNSGEPLRVPSHDPPGGGVSSQYEERVKDMLLQAFIRMQDQHGNGPPQ